MKESLSDGLRGNGLTRRLHDRQQRQRSLVFSASKQNDRTLII